LKIFIYDRFNKDIKNGIMLLDYSNGTFLLIYISIEMDGIAFDFLYIKDINFTGNIKEMENN